VPRALQEPEAPRTLMMINQGRRAHQPTRRCRAPMHNNKEPPLPWPYKERLNASMQ